MLMEQIQKEWEEDSKLDRTELGEESLRIPKLHSKYWNIFCAERQSLRVREAQLNELTLDKTLYYMGSFDEEMLKKYGWEPFRQKILRSDLELFLKADKELVALSERVEQQRDKVKFCEDIIKSLVNRGYNIRAAIEWERFKVGA